MQKVRLGIVGAGKLGGFHANKAAAHPEVDFVGVADVSAENRRALAQKHGVADFDSLEKLLPNVDAVIVAAPSCLHAELGRQILEAGKHLLMEKPATTDGRSARELAALASARGLTMQVGHVEEYNPAWRAAKNYLADVASGFEPAFIDATRASGYSFRCVDVGAVHDLMIHDLELILSLIPAPVDRVSAFGYSQFGGFEDAAFATIEFANGSVARVAASRIEPSPRRFTTIRTARQTLEIDFAARKTRRVAPKETILRGDFAPERVSFAQMAPRVATFMAEEYETEELVKEPFDALELEMADFVSAILRGTPSTAPGERAARAVALADDVLEAISRNVAAARPALRVA